MCGILGGTNFTWNYQAGIDSIKHRGPDGIRIEKIGDLAVMAFARLAIIDLSKNGMQPMTSFDGSVTIVYNGEIYGYGKLKEDLCKKYEFKSNTDSEVILYSYCEYGLDFINKIDGMFSIALLDKRKKSIYLYRDRAGIKPLYYMIYGEDFAFASEIKAITSLDDNFSIRQDNTSIYDYLTYMYIPEPKTMYKEIRKLEPGHFIEYSLVSKKIKQKQCYWEIDCFKHFSNNIGMREAIQENRRLVSASVKKQLVADVKVGSLLSGGVDSSIITYEISKEMPGVNTYSMIFGREEENEEEYIDILASQLDIVSNKRLYSRRDFFRTKDRVPNWFDEPFADKSAFITNDVMEMAKNDVKVLLTGDGGDEVYGGYNWIDTFYNKEKYNNRIISKIYELCVRPYIFNNSLSQWDDVVLDPIAYYNKKHGNPMLSDKMEYRKKLMIPKDYDDYWFIRKFYKKDLPPIARAQYIEFKTYLPMILCKVDRISMFHSIEVRVPFLAREIIEFSFSLPDNIRCPEGLLKDLLKKTYPEIPGVIYGHPKVGFSIPEYYYGYKYDSKKQILRKYWNI